MLTKEAALRERVADLLMFERSVEHRADNQARTPHAQTYCADLIRTAGETARRHGQALADYLGVEHPASDHPALTSLIHTSSATALVQGVLAVASHAVGAYTVLAAMAFRLYEPRLRELGPKHLQAYIALEYDTAQRLAEVAAEELAGDGLECHCICPMCGLGACGCVAITRQALHAAWRDVLSRPSSGEGFPLQTPRRGSPLHAAGALRGDRLLAVDGTAVRGVPDIQAGIRKHAIGDTVQLLLHRDPEPPWTIDVTHVSDYPKT